MDEEIRKSLRASIEQMMIDKKMTWYTMQTVKLKDVLKIKRGKKTYKCPVEWQTLNSIVTKPECKPHPNTQEKLLIFFGTKYERLFNDIKLT